MKMTYNSMVPFYDMKNPKEFNSGRLPTNPHEEMAGLQEAIEATKKRIAEHKANNWDTSEFDKHLESLEQRLEAAKKK